MKLREDVAQHIEIYGADWPEFCGVCGVRIKPYVYREGKRVYCETHGKAVIKAWETYYNGVK